MRVQVLEWQLSNRHAHEIRVNASTIKTETKWKISKYNGKIAYKSSEKARSKFQLLMFVIKK